MAKRTRKDIDTERADAIQGSLDDIAVAAEQLRAVDLARATELEAIGTEHGLLPQLQQEIDALRDANRFEARIQQLSRKV